MNETRTHDKRLTLLHFIVQTIEERFPDLIQFDQDFQSIEKAAQGETTRRTNEKSFNSFRLVSLENIQTDVQDLTRGLENARKELVIRQNLKVSRHNRNAFEWKFRSFRMLKHNRSTNFFN